MTDPWNVLTISIRMDMDLCTPEKLMIFLTNTEGVENVTVQRARMKHPPQTKEDPRR